MMRKVKEAFIAKYDFMTKPMVIKLPLGHNITTNLSNMCGHGSFVMLALGYMESDVLLLRMYATSGIVLSILFQYYRPQPLWIPISWNSLFFAINLGMITLILADRAELSDLESEVQSLYENTLHDQGMSKMEFSRLLAIAKRRTLSKGEVLKRCGVRQHSLFVVVKGRANISHDGHLVGSVNKNHFVGSVAFMTFLTSEVADSFQQTDIPNSDVICSSEEMLVYEWDFDDLRDYLNKHPHIFHTFQSSMTHDLAQKLSETWRTDERYRCLLEGALLEGRVGEVVKTMLEHYRSKHDIDHKRHLQILEELGWTAQEFAGRSCWGGGQDNVGTLSFKDDIDHKRHLQILEELGWTAQEFAQGYQHQKVALKEYLGLLNAETKKGKISDKAKERLRKFRSLVGIDVEDHLMSLAQVGWTLDEYEAGKKDKKSSNASLSA
eukprot:CAMPEP_0117849618 /NCGR_PEP_ID=MMETSP0949-20121206/21202_1 /TAXON_ID=44440 /ORGANISM="Chattonella subsalsa, Strain CCMP2191" /LENGTH=436 /DNA_ID=CAMNT_0005696861 /DNA_START=498 /DNA_END=1809 /DNA_ORIENTATION=-